MKLADIVKFYEFLYQENPYALNQIYQREANLLSHNVDELTLEEFHSDNFIGTPSKQANFCEVCVA